MSFIYSIIPYFGILPNYFQLYLDSVEINSDILKIILISDNDFSNYKIPLNVIIINLSICQVRERIILYFKKYHNVNINLNEVLTTPYKLCDFRVVYKFLFLDILENIGVKNDDYWGWSDCDLIYGNILKNIPNIRIYEFIGWNGHFTAIKNKNLYDNYLLSIDNLKNNLLSNKNKIIDEVSYRIMLKKYVINKISFLCLKTINPQTDVFYILDVIPPPPRIPHKIFHGNLFKLNDENEINYITFDKKNRKLIASFKNLDDKEFIYAHLQKRKMEIKFNNYNDKFYINKYCFYNKISEF